MKTIRTGGFTLIELLTVIAIIAILAAMSMTVGPRILEKGKLAAYSNTCNQIRTAAVAYFTKYKESYPPSYGYIDKSYLTDPNVLVIPRVYRPYMAYLELFRNFGVYDSFAKESCDTDRDGVLSLLEFSPVGRPEGPVKYEFEREEIYNGSNLPGEVTEQLKTQRPIVYIAVNLKQAQKVAEYYDQVAGSRPDLGWNARVWDPTAAPIAGLTFPPTKYDDFVLISPGPGGSTGGILTPPGDPFMGVLQASGIPIEDWYHILGLRAHFLATRDANHNGLWDFDYRNRSRQGEGKPSSYDKPDLNLLPDGTNGAGPIIYAPNSTGVSQ